MPADSNASNACYAIKEGCITASPPPSDVHRRRPRHTAVGGTTNQNFPMWLRRATLTVGAAVATAYTYAATADVYAGPIGRRIQALDPERAHNLAITLAKYDLAAPPRLPLLPSPARRTAPSLATTVWGLAFDHPIGLAAGFDKNAEAVPGLFHIGFSFLEVGTITPRPQPGNPKPRVFRLPSDGAIINRYGFNSHGARVVLERLNAFNYGGGSTNRYGVLGVNLGKNKDTPQDAAVDDYMQGLKLFGELAEYIVINVSSPNTPGLRSLQSRKHLRDLLGPILKHRDSLVYRPPIVLKIAPDLTLPELRDICTVASELRIDGLIVSNTTVDKSTLTSAHRGEAGGVSGRPLRDMSTRMVHDVYSLTEGRIPIVGVGGIECGQDAYDKIRAGASLVQIYTALAYKGPWVVHTIKTELAHLLERDGFKCVADAVGADHRIEAAVPKVTKIGS